MEWIIAYIATGVIVNVWTMFDKEDWSYWIEFGVVGFVFQFVISVIFFPLVLKMLIDELLIKE